MGVCEVERSRAALAVRIASLLHKEMRKGLITAWLGTLVQLGVSEFIRLILVSPQ